MSKLNHYQRYQGWYGFAMLGAYLSINAVVNATTVIMDARRGGELPFELWAPFVWEFSSAVTIFGLIWPIAWLTLKRPFDWSRVGFSVLMYALAALTFSIAHVSIMIAIREVVYSLLGSSYDFGPILLGFVYEFRKDLLTFILILIVVFAYRFIVSRLMGEANLLAEGEEPASDTPVVASLDRLLVKKLGKEFIVKLEDVEWMESSGNYVNLHVKERIYPIRKTLHALTQEIADKGFCRIHRSHAINLDSVDSIEPSPSGDAEVTLSSGKVLNISRRYKDELKQRLL